MKSSVFDQLQTQVIRAGLCTHCGTCVGLSNGALEMSLSSSKGPLPVLVAADGADIPSVAFESCPGKGLSYPALYESVFGCLPQSWLVGHYRGLYVGYSCDPCIRERGASGGVITQTLIYLLERGLIDGAVVVQQGRSLPWRADPIIAESVEDILECSQSVYVPVPVNVLLSQMEAFRGRLAYVGLPDQVASLRRLQQLGHPAVARVDYVIGPYVGTIMYLAAIECYLRSNGIQSLDDVAELRYREGEWPGYLQVRTRSGRVLRAAKFYYNYLIPFFITKSSLLAVDFTNELTDISVGDAWHPRYEAQGKGFSVVVARSEKGQALLQSMQCEGLIELEAIQLDDALSMHGHMIDFKKRGSFIRLGWRKALGLATPDYGYRPAKIPFSRILVEAGISATFALCGTRVARRLLGFFPSRLISFLFETLRRLWKRATKPAKRRGLKDTAFEVCRAI